MNHRAIPAPLPRLSVIAFLLAVGSFAPTYGHAAHYEVAYSSANVRFAPNGNAPYTQPYYKDPDGCWYGGGSCRQSATSGGLSPGSVTANDAFTVTLTWTKDAGEAKLPRAPMTVLVKEEAGAGFSGDSGSADDGIGHVWGGGGTSGSITGTNTIIYNATGAGGFDTISYTRTPSATSTTAFRYPSNASVKYKASATVPKLSLSGHTVNGDLFYMLIGQQLSATLSAGSATVKPGDAVTWTVSGGNPFASYTRSTSQGDIPGQAQRMGSGKRSRHDDVLRGKRRY